VRGWRIAATCGLVWAASVAPPASVTPAQEPRRGGRLRIGVLESFGFTDSFDPTGEYLGFAWSIYSNLLLRTLVTYEHVDGREGLVPVADLATQLQEPTDDGTTYTFRLKKHVRFGPPLDRPITSRDIEYAFERIATPALAAQYAYYYEVIDGFEDFRHERARDISGIETPNARTIVFHLRRPVGDFLQRLSLSATAPIPREVARCARHAGEYGRFVIASGPYMIEGSENLVVDDGCRAMKPLTGYRPEHKLALVRNPDYDVRSDDPEIRESFVDEVRFRIFRKGRVIWSRIEEGRLDSAAVQVSEKVVHRYQSEPGRDATLATTQSDRTWYLTMNLTQAPFDDVHVRRAVNLAIDKEEIRAAWGGEIAGDIATHVLPPNLTGGHPDGSEYDPYATPDHRGDLDAARAEMRLSRYDADGDGICDAPECDDIRALNRNYGAWAQMQGTVVEQLRAIGIDLAVHQTVDFYTPVMTISKNVPMGLGPGWGKDYADPHTFMPFLFRRPKQCTGNINYALVGATPKTRRECHAKGSFDDLPAVDDRITRCDRMPAGDERTRCWVDLDRHLMEDVVPWVPYLWQNAIRLIGPAVTKYELDQFSAELGFAHMAVDESRQN
jgi:peptide/nickel transport system substrate-binding protein